MSTDKSVFLQCQHDIAVCEDSRAFERLCRSGRPAVLWVPENDAALMHEHFSQKLRFRPFTAHETDAYPGKRVIASPAGEKPPSLAGHLAERQPLHTDAAAHGPQWLQDMMLTYLKADSAAGGCLEIASLDQLLDRQSGSAIHLMLNMTVEVQRDIGERTSVYRGPMMLPLGRNEFAFRFRYDSVAKMRCAELDPWKRRDGDQLIKLIAAELEALPKTVIKPGPGMICHLTQSGPAELCLLHGRSPATAPQVRVAIRDWLNYAHR